LALQTGAVYTSTAEVVHPPESGVLNVALFLYVPSVPPNDA
jgi:hypothetical protein